MPVVLKLLKDPLLHFLLAGLALFVLFEFVVRDQPAPGEDVILVDREALLTFMQYRSKAFQREVAAARLDALSEDERRRFIDDYVREEALHREALALGMDADDYIIKRRLIQKMEFITAGFITAGTDLSDDYVAAYYQANKDDYYVEPYVTFTHVFFDNERHGREQARALAAAKLARLNSERAQFADAPRHGDRFLYHTNYVERVAQFVASHFGATMAEKLFASDPNDLQWRGPFESPYGFHLVLLTDKIAGHYPKLEAIQARVVQDARRAFIREKSEEAVRAIVDGYEVHMVYRPSPENAKAPALSSATTARTESKL